MAKTTRGRVVYNRKVHLFTYEDVLRIIRKVDVRSAPDEGRVRELGAAAAAVLAALADVEIAIKQLDLGGLPPELVGDFVLEVLARLLSILSRVPERAGQFLQTVLDSLSGFDPGSIFRRDQNGQTDEGQLR